jgi:steroid 5-alpha reductase family enzyme
MIPPMTSASAAVLVVAALAVATAAACRVLSARTGDASWTDRIWSIAPVVYLAVFAGAAGFADTRLDLMALLGLVWGIRLTANFARRGGYRGVEDHRWPIIRARLSRRGWAVFDTLFVAGFQNALLVLLTLPALTALEHEGTPFGAVDAVLTLAFLALLAGETVADQQQWRFQEAKRARIAAGEDPGPGFVQTGLWRWSRHPNYCFEIGQWWVMAGFAIAAAGALPWTIAGALLLAALFAGSIRFTESITASRYPAYAEYRRRTSALIPLPPLRRADPEDNLDAS